MVRKVSLIVCLVLITLLVSIGVARNIYLYSHENTYENPLEDRDTLDDEEINEEDNNNGLDNNVDNDIDKEDTTQNDTTNTQNNNPNPSLERKLISSNTAVEAKESYKYKMKVTSNVTYQIDTYSDGYIDKKVLKEEIVSYDNSTFSATTNELLQEGKDNATKNKSIYNELVGYVNNYRKEVNAQNLVLDDDLSVAATIRAMELGYSGKFSHTRPSGAVCFSILSDLNITYSTSGENIAYNTSNAKDTATLWRNSKEHYNNMINFNYQKIGIGMFEFKGVKYWVQLFTN